MVITFFRVKNFRSFKEDTIITFGTSEFASSCPLPTAIYGNTASGKSNFIKAIQYMRDLVLSEKITYKNESFCNNDEPCEFEIEFGDNISTIEVPCKYRYGFSIIFSKEFGIPLVKSEWLFENDINLFFRENFNNYKFGDKFKILEKIYIEKHDGLTLEIIDLISRDNFKYFDISSVVRTIYSKFRRLGIINNLTINSDDINNLLLKFLSCEVSLRYALNFAKCLDSSIKDIVIKSGKIFIIRKFRNKLSEVGGSFEFEFDLVDEPSSIQRVIFIASKLIYTETLIIDDLDLNLHPLSFVALTEYVVKEQLKGNQQLIFSANDTIVVKRNVINEDQQLWFVTKMGNTSKLMYFGKNDDRRNHRLNGALVGQNA